MSHRIQTATGAPFQPLGTFHEHRIAIHNLAHDLDLPEPVVADIYWPQLASLQEGATIDVYLPLLTERRVRERLQRGKGPGKARRTEEHTDQLVAA